MWVVTLRVVPEGLAAASAAV
ncbi:PE family protein, partial [Mycobacterium tuberculosis]